MSSNTVLVTGASGFLGSQVVDQLLEAGYKVRGTARSTTAPRLQESYKSFGDRFQVAIVEDIATSDLSEAFKGVDAIIHVASPLAGAASAEVVLRSAVDGTTRVLDAAVAAGVHKIVITSSIIALTTPTKLATAVVVDENGTSDLTYEEAIRPGTEAMTVYAASKALADKTTWEYAKAHPELDIAAIYPPFLWGPSGRGQVLDGPTAGTNSIVYSLINGPKGRPVPAVSAIATFINNIDAARAHVNALKLPKSDKPKRIVPNAGEYTWVQAVRYLEKTRPELKDRLPVVEGEGPAVPPHATFDDKTARAVGLDTYISFEETVGAVIDQAVRREKELGITPSA
ncbi:NAD-P-binding protein [Artomyces pyxidatus]|uniref:NAD-P-binding protein n=1 Tax=Artomyces pyxidatus TaxID=48021 RepID=A0ACB8SG12_9AGAM|nr:NAD-P-binding protein [Artomyces pyxidatus]